MAPTGPADTHSLHSRHGLYASGYGSGNSRRDRESQGSKVFCFQCGCGQGMEGQLLVREDELSRARDQIHGLVIQRQEEYDVFILVYTVPLYG
jgi:hypothetical protein